MAKLCIWSVLLYCALFYRYISNLTNFMDDVWTLCMTIWLVHISIQRYIKCLNLSKFSLTNPLCQHVPLSHSIHNTIITNRANIFHHNLKTDVNWQWIILTSWTGTNLMTGIYNTPDRLVLAVWLSLTSFPAAWTAEQFLLSARNKLKKLYEH